MAVDSEINLAVLIDADNTSRKNMKAVMDEIAKYGIPTIKHAFGDWASPALAGWKDVLLEIAAVPIQQYAYTTGKNATDAAMIIDAMDILHDGNVGGFVLVSSDSDFTPLVMRLRESGVKVIGIGEQKTPKPFIKACDKFIYVEVLAPVVSEMTVGQPEAAQTETSISPESASLSLKKKTISNKTVGFIAENIAEAAGDNGSCKLAVLGALLNKKRPDFDSRNYGYSQLSKMLRSIPRFEVTGSGPSLSVKDIEAK